MRLALELGWPNYEAMLATMEPHQLERWKDYYRQEPFGRNWHRMSAMAAGICNQITLVAQALGVKQELFKEDSFVPKFCEPKEVDPVEGLRGLVGL